MQFAALDAPYFWPYSVAKSRFGPFIRRYAQWVLRKHFGFHAVVFRCDPSRNVSSQSTHRHVPVALPQGDVFCLEETKWQKSGKLLTLESNSTKDKDKDSRRKRWRSRNEREWLAENIWATLKFRSPSGQTRYWTICFRYERKKPVKEWQLRLECIMMMRPYHVRQCESAVEHGLVYEWFQARQCKRAVLFRLESHLPAFLKFRNSRFLTGIKLLSKGMEISFLGNQKLRIFLKFKGRVWYARGAGTAFFFLETMVQILEVVNIH